MRIRRKSTATWQKMKQPVPITWRSLIAAGSAFGLVIALAITLGTIALLKVTDEAGDRRLDRAQDRRKVESIARRVVRIERQPSRQLIRRLERNLELCRRFPECAAALDRDRPPPRRRDDTPPDPRADRPPRQVNPPPESDPDPVAGPPDPPGSAAPELTTPAPGAPTPDQRSLIVEIDPPPVDVDGPDGLLPELLPKVNVPPVDLPPIRLP